MYIDKVSLRNIRGFEELDFTLARSDGSHAGWTVFTGDNGSGKSTLLKAIAVGLTGRDTAQALQPSFNRWVREQTPKAAGAIRLEITPVAGDDLADDDSKAGTSITARLTLKPSDRETTLRAAAVRSKTKDAPAPDQTIWSPDSTGWFACGYGPFRRVFGESSATRQIMSTPRIARFGTLFQETASLAETDTWLRELKFKSLENRAAERDQLNLLIELLNADLMPNQIRVDQVDSDGLWLVDRNGVRLAWGDMSDGYRAMLALLADIVHHLINAYSINGLVAYDEHASPYITRSGVVLIDEIDAHLHPEWQREIGFWLKHRFPKIQFLVTTHSPIICQAADPNGLFVLPEPGSDQRPHALSDEEFDRVIASRPDTILLTSAFGLQNTRSEEAVKARSEYARLQSKQRAVGTLSAADQARMTEVAVFALNDEEL